MAAPLLNLCVFVYGTFLSDEVVRTLLGRMPEHAPAFIKNYRRYAVVMRDYPAIIPAKGYEVEGRVLCKLTKDELRVLDVFEGYEYVRQPTKAYPLDANVITTSADMSTLRGSRKVFKTTKGALSWAEFMWGKGVPHWNATAYIWKDKEGAELEGPWDYLEWRREHLEEFLEKCKEFIHDIKTKLRATA